jgi:cell division protein FtsI/penicillin-binding protein 2
MINLELQESALRVEGIDICGKTGTAETLPKSMELGLN